MSTETKVRGRGHTFTLIEEIDLIKGFNTYGSGNWCLIFMDSRLCLRSFKHRKREHLCPKWKNLKKKCRFDDFFYLPGLKDECMPLPSKETGNTRSMDEEDILHPVAYDEALEGVHKIEEYEVRKYGEGFIFNFKEHGSIRKILFADVVSHYIQE